MPEVGVESPTHFGQHLGEFWGNGFSCERLQAVAAGCGLLHSLTYEVKRDKFAFIYDDGRSNQQRTPQVTAILEENSRLRDRLQKAEARTLDSDRGYGAIVQQLEEAKLEGNLRVEAKKKAEAELKETKKELVAEKIAREKAEKTARNAEKKVSEVTEQLSRMKQSKSDSQAAVGIVEEDWRRKVAEIQEGADRWKQRALTAEKSSKKSNEWAQSEKTLRVAAEQHAGELNVMWEAAQQRLQDIEEALEQNSESKTKLQEAEKRRQSAEDRCAKLAADNRHLRNGLALLQAEEEAVAEIREARLFSLQKKVSDLEGQVSKFESAGDGCSNVILCLDKDGNEIKFELNPNGSLDVFKNEVIYCGLRALEFFNTISGKVFETFGSLKALEIDREVPTDDNSAEAGFVTHCAAADPGTRGPYKRPNTNTGHGAWRDGDWKCDSCGFSNFERRTECKACNKPRFGEEERERARIRSKFRRDIQFRRQLLDRMELPERVAND